MALKSFFDSYATLPRIAGSGKTKRFSPIVYKERIINGALADVFKRAPARLVAVSGDTLLDADLTDDLSADIGDLPDAGDEPVSDLPH